MWKYQCKRQLLYIVIGAAAGALIFGAMDYQKEAIMKILREYTSDPEILGNAAIPYITGAITMAGIVNGLTLFWYVIQKFNMSFLFVLLLFWLGGYRLALMIGTAGLPVCVIIYLYGWLTVPNRGKKRQLDKNALSTVQEVERVFRLHHHYDEAYEDMAKGIWQNLLKINLLSAAGIVVLMLVFLYVEDPMVFMLCMVLYFGLFYQLVKRKNMMLQPIVSLLYEKCDPEGCASAIFALAKRFHRKKSFPLPQQLAQCMLYLDDPHLAVDVLSSANLQSKNGMQYAYHSLMAYAYYQLGDRSMVQHHYDTCTKLTVGGMKGPLTAIRTQTLQAIENKLHLMDQKFSKAEEFYKALFQGSVFLFQKVDAQYYLGLIAFVQKDIRTAEGNFRYVAQNGNKMFFVQKAKEYLSIIERMEQEEEQL